MTQEEMYFQMPSNQTTGPAEVLFTLPNQMTGGVFVNMWLAALYGVLMIGATRYQQSIQAASLFASFGTFTVTFLLVALSSFVDVAIAGGNQLIAAAVLLMANMVWNYMSGGRI